MDNPELIEKYDARLSEFLTKMHNDGIRLGVIIFLLDQKLGNLKMMEYASSYLESNAPESVEKGHEAPVSTG